MFQKLAFKDGDGKSRTGTLYPDVQQGQSFQNEDKIIEYLVSQMGLADSERYYVDVGASNGIQMSNTFALVASGWSGISVEANADKFACLANYYRSYEGASLFRGLATPENILKILSAFNAPKRFGFLSLDIDGYDWFVLEKMLEEYRPSIICMEINESLPPPLKFSVLYRPDYWWQVNHFFGCSISKVSELAERNDYGIYWLEYNNLFLLDKRRVNFPSVSAEEAYRKGYVNREDRQQKFYWNEGMDALIGMNPADAIEFVKDKFSQYEGMYTLEV
jgi:hypothetical protein